MNAPNKTHATDAHMIARPQSSASRQTWSGLVFTLAAVAILFIIPQYLLPPYNGVAMSFGAAAMLTVYVHLYPEPFRSRSGSLVPAYWLAAALWLLAVVSTGVSLLG